MLELQQIRAGYGHLQVLFDVDLRVEAGEMVTIVGANGAGKSTLLKTILGAVNATSGEILFLGERVTHMPAHRRVQHGIALSPEGRQVFASLSVKENLVSGTFGLPAKDVKKQIDHVYDLFPRLRERTNQRAGSLSGGEQQMLAVGRALMSQPRLVLVDELSLGLAPIIVEKLYGALRQLCEAGLAVVMVEQFHLAVAGRADKQFALDKGRFVDVGATAGISRTNGHGARDAALMQTSGLVGHATERGER
jgi:branched-chain amino acid transport system ATP-binding protein